MPRTKRVTLDELTNTTQRGAASRTLQTRRVVVAAKAQAARSVRSVQRDERDGREEVTKYFSLRMSATEHNRLRKNAAKKMMTIAQYVRAVAIYA